MTKEQFVAKLHQDLHLTWKHAFWICGGVVAAFVALASANSVNSSRIESHQRELDARAPAVIELARVAQQLHSEASANREFRADTKEHLKRIEDKLDRVLDK